MVCRGMVPSLYFRDVVVVLCSESPASHGLKHECLTVAFAHTTCFDDNRQRPANRIKWGAVGTVRPPSACLCGPLLVSPIPRHHCTSVIAAVLSIPLPGQLVWI